MSAITLIQLKEAMPFSGERAGLYLLPLNEAMQEFEVDTPLRQACFLAQIAHESGSLKYTLELADGSDYEGRADLGNTVPGDGRKYRGRGLIQITGRTNTLACLKALGWHDDEQARFETPVGACRSAGWFWKSRGLSAHADQGNFWTISRTINGGTMGLDDRIKHYIRARRALGV